MSQYQQRTHKWHPPATDVVLDYISKQLGSYTPKEVAKKLKIKQSNVGIILGRFYKEGYINRKECDCGQSYIYYRE